MASRSEAIWAFLEDNTHSLQSFILLKDLNSAGSDEGDIVVGWLNEMIDVRGKDG